MPTPSPTLPPYESPYGSLESMVWVVLALLLVFVGAYFVTRFVSGRASGLARSKYIRPVDSVMIARDKSVMLLEASGKYYLVGVTGQNIQLIGTISPDELEPIRAAERPGDTQDEAQGFAGKMAKWVAAFASAPARLQKARQGQQSGEQTRASRAQRSRDAAAQTRQRGEADQGRESTQEDLNSMLQAIKERKARLARDEDENT